MASLARALGACSTRPARWSVRRQLRAIALMLVVAVNLIYAIPVPHMKEEALSDPDWFMTDMQRWTHVLGMVGIELTPEQLQHGVRGIAWRYKQGVLAVREPVAPLFRSIKANQQWGLFGAVTEIPDRLVIEVDRGDGYVPVFVKLDPEHDWREPVWRYRRIRGIWDSVKDGDKPRGTYRRLSMWTSRQLFLEDPSIQRVRFKLERLQPERSVGTGEPRDRGPGSAGPPPRGLPVLQPARGPGARRAPSR